MIILTPKVTTTKNPLTLFTFDQTIEKIEILTALQILIFYMYCLSQSDLNH